MAEPKGSRIVGCLVAAALLGGGALADPPAPAGEARGATRDQGVRLEAGQDAPQGGGAARGGAEEGAAPVAEKVDLQSLVRDLDSPEVERRLAATTELHEHGGIKLRDLEEVLLRQDLSAEQRQRLLGVAEWRFRSEPRAALGFSGPAAFGDRNTQGVPIHNVIPGFPASDVLRAGDRILSADGAPLANFQSIRPVIVSRDPGEELRLVLVREGATLNVTVQLGSFRQLPEGGQLDDGVLAEAWELRSRRLRGTRGEPVPSGLPSERWESERVDPADLRAIELARPGAADDGRIGVVIGGEPRGASDRAVRVMNLLGDPEALRGAAADPRVQQMNQLQQRRDQWALQMEAIDRALANPGLPPEQRGSLEQSRAQLAQAIANHDAQIRRILLELARER